MCVCVCGDTVTPHGRNAVLQLILSDKPRLFYIDDKASPMQFRGEVPWSSKISVVLKPDNPRLFDVLTVRGSPPPPPRDWARHHVRCVTVWRRPTARTTSQSRTAPARSCGRSAWKRRWQRRSRGGQAAASAVVAAPVVAPAVAPAAVGAVVAAAVGDRGPCFVECTLLV